MVLIRFRWTNSLISVLFLTPLLKKGDCDENFQMSLRLSSGLRLPVHTDEGM
jgi:hypothetical protein